MNNISATFVETAPILVRVVYILSVVLVSSVFGKLLKALADEPPNGNVAVAVDIGLSYLNELSAKNVLCVKAPFCKPICFTDSVPAIDV